MTKKLRVTKLEVETKDGKKVALTLDEAQELYEQLHGLFGKESPGTPSYPLIIERDRWYPPWPYYNYNPVWRSDTASQPIMPSRAVDYRTTFKLRGPNLVVGYYCESA